MNIVGWCFNPSKYEERPFEWGERERQRRFVLFKSESEETDRAIK